MALGMRRKSRLRLNLNAIHQLLAYVVDINLLEDNIDTIKKTDILIDAGREVGLEVNAGITKYMLLSSHQNAWKILDTELASRSLKNVEQLKHLSKSGNYCYHSVQNLSSFRLWFKKNSN
jgi:hypothetical protein